MITLGIVLILIGLSLWLEKIGFSYFALVKNWPVILIIIGLSVLIRGLKKKTKRIKIEK
ncbi:MAG: DUF5668 domain-containing protein [candidate division WOR-3 bacterium]